MATYGSRDKNPFKPGGSLGETKYYLLVDSTTGEITIKSPTVAGNVGGANADRTIGKIPLDNAFQPTPGSTTSNELTYFSSADGQKSVKNKAVITAQKGGAQNANQLIFPNTALPGAGEGQDKPPAAKEKPKPGEKERQELENLKFRSRDNYEQMLTYPEKLDRNFQDYIKFQMVQYKPRGLGSPNNIGVIAPRERINTSDQPDSTRNILGSVVLPIPGNISDGNTVSWGDFRMDPLVTALTEAAVLGVKQGIPGLESFGKKAEESITKNTSSFKSAVVGAFVQNATGINPLTRMYGVVANPNLELLFNGPDLRNFTFTFRFSPRDAKEAVIVKKIIRFFKQGMSVKRTEGELFLGSPHTFQLSYWNTKTREHPYLNKFKECALKSFSVNYAPDGTYMTYNHRDEPSMTAYEITMQFTELEPVFDDDYAALDKNNDTQIGY